MLHFLKNIGMKDFTDKKSIDALVSFTFEEGHAICGYYNNPYINAHCGKAQFILSTQKKLDSQSGLNEYEVSDFDVHAIGSTVWNVRIIDEINTNSNPETGKCLLVGKANSDSGMAVVNVVNADVLPSFLEGDTYKLQMIGFAEEFDYYENEEAYNEALPKDELNRSFGTAEGCIFPIGFLNDKLNKNENDEGIDYHDHTLLRGKVKWFGSGKLQFGDNDPIQTFLYVVIDTQFGELQIVHAIDQIKEEQREYMRVGATIRAICKLSGDAAIYEYENGIIKDEEHHLNAIRYALVKGKANRLRTIFSDDVVYISDHSEMTFTGVDNVINRLNDVHRDTKYDYYAHMATIVDIKDNADTVYKTGKKCAVLAIDDPDDYTSIVFIECDDSRKVNKLHVSTDPRYIFKLDE